MEDKVKCKHCGTEMDKNATICPNCRKRQKLAWWQIALIVLGVIILIGIVFSDGDSNSNNSENKTAQNVEENKEKNKYTLGETFEFDDLEITFGTEVSFVTLDNQFSEHNGASVVRLPITVKNNKSQNHNLNMFYIKTFGTKGTELDSVSSYFMEDCVEFGGELREGASYTKYMYFLYDGDGEYEIVLDNIVKTIKVDFNIAK